MGNMRNMSEVQKAKDKTNCKLLHLTYNNGPQALGSYI